MEDCNLDFLLRRKNAADFQIPVFDAQILTYPQVAAKRVGLLTNFHSRLLKDGIKRIVL